MVGCQAVGMGKDHQVSIYYSLSQVARLSEWGNDVGGVVPECLPRQSKSKAVRGDRRRDGRGSVGISGQAALCICLIMRWLRGPGLGG